MIRRKLTEAFNRVRFDFALRSIHATPVVVPGTEPFVLLSMVHHRDVEPYLLAVKSFVRFLGPRRIIMVADPSITANDRALVTQHIPFVEFLRAEDFREAALPQGGCWERLIAISECVGTDYVVQLDADTVTVADLPEVREAVRTRKSFVLATEDRQNFVTCQEAARWAKQNSAPDSHVQTLAETGLDTLRGAESRKYVRGCAGFSGFAPRSFSREDLRALSRHMSTALASRWSAWGTEQFASNLMVANAPRAVVLPHPKYCHPGREKPGTVFLHFIGYVRFANGRYARAAREVCTSIRGVTQAAA